MLKLYFGLFFISYYNQNLQKEIVFILNTSVLSLIRSTQAIHKLKKAMHLFRFFSRNAYHKALFLLCFTITLVFFLKKRISSLNPLQIQQAFTRPLSASVFCDIRITACTGKTSNLDTRLQNPYTVSLTNYRTLISSRMQATPPQLSATMPPCLLCVTCGCLITNQPSAIV